MKQDMWTDDRKLEALLRLPWQLRLSHDEDGYWVLKVDGVPSALAIGSTPEEAESNFWESLRESLSVFLEHGDPIPLPPGVQRYPWYKADGVRVVQGQIQGTATLAFAGT